MPKSGDNSRPYNRTQKKQAQRDKKVLKRTNKAEGPYSNASFSGSGPGRKHTGAGESAQATRSLARMTDKLFAKKIKGRRGRK